MSKSKIALIGLLMVSLFFLYGYRLDVEGTYTFVNDGDCHLLSFHSDTLILHSDGRVESKNFPIDAIYTRKKSLFEDEIKISSENEYSYLLVRGNIFTGTRLIVCLDVVGFYQMK